MNRMVIRVPPQVQLELRNQQLLLTGKQLLAVRSLFLPLTVGQIACEGDQLLRCGPLDVRCVLDSSVCFHCKRA